MNKNYLKDFVPYEQALALKEIGFDEPCLMAYLGKEKEPYLKCDDTWHLQAKDVLNPLKTPTFSQAFRWFREKYGLCSWIERMYTADSICYYRYTCEYKKDPSSKTHEVILSIKEYNTYEEAELTCLKKLIEIVKQQP